MIPRYSTPEMERIWTDESKFQKMLEIEILACEAMAKIGKIPANAPVVIRKKARIDVKRIKKIEDVTRHDVIAFLTQLEEVVGPEAKYIHKGLTSSDVLDTALSLQMRESLEIILDDLVTLAAVLKKKAKKYKNTLMVGRTHGIYAEPITFGFKISLWYAETLRNIERVRQLIPVISVGKISGAVGTYANVDPRVEAYVCRKLKFTPAPVSTQVLQRDRHAQYVSTLAICAATIEKIATEIRNLQRSDIREVEEFFAKGQKGSSAMPHKRNPITCEQLCGLARIIRANTIPALENVALWHERDISHSSVERVILPDSSILMDYMLKKTIKIMENLLVYPENMLENLEKSKGLIFSQQVLLSLIDKGIDRQQAYVVVQRNAMRVWQEKGTFLDYLKEDADLQQYFSPAEITALFDYKYHLKNIDKIFKRLKI
ncbi:MAG: adenylosuccinate lyase [bacterium]|nr:adenylosuccinate lyase [bacterium]